MTGRPAGSPAGRFPYRRTMRRKLLVPIVAILTVLALAGCVRFQADLSLNPDDTVDGSIVVAVVLGDDAAAKDNAADAVASIETELLGGVSGAVGATRSEYDQDGYYGTRFSFDDTPIAAFDGTSSDGSMRLTREGDEFVFEGLLDFTPDDGQVEADPDDDTSNITVKITFPGEVTDHNGELSGRTVSWSATPESRVEMSAQGGAIAVGPPAWVPIVVLVVGALVVAAIAVVVDHGVQTPDVPQVRQRKTVRSAQYRADLAVHR